MKAEELKLVVKEKYGSIAGQSNLLEQKQGCCGSSGCCGELEFSMIGDEYTNVAGYNPDADLGLGCGLPTEFAGIKVGDSLLDLGSGAGNDCFVARSLVGETGKVTGLDFTREMILKANQNLTKTGFKNIEFVQGDIEEMPLPDNSFDVVISNCVLNLVPDKQKAFSEIYRVLKPGGHICISDVVTSDKLPIVLQETAEMYAGCVSGATEKQEYLKIIERQGFSQIEIRKEKPITIPENVLTSYLNGSELNHFKNSGTGIFSITVTAKKYLTIWVALGILAGIGLGYLSGDSIEVISRLEFARVNIPVAVLIWLMIYPMMLQIDFTSIKDIGKKPRGVVWTLIINWAVKPFSMAFFAWIFFSKIYAAWIDPALADEYIAGAIILGAAPCTAMVFVWSYLTDGDPNYTLVQVSVNDLIILVAFVPIVGLLLGITDIAIPYDTLIASVIIFVVVPLSAGVITQRMLINHHGEDWFKTVFLPRLKPVSIVALLVTLVLLFAFQGKNILNNPLIIFLAAVPLVIQTYFIFFLAWFGGRKLKLPHPVCAPAAMIGASNFFELAVAVAIALFGLNSPAALVTVVGVLVEVPVMLSLVALANRWKY